VLERFGKKGKVSPVYAIPSQIVVYIAGHEDHAQVFSHAERTDGQLVAMHVGELIGARCQLKSRRGKDEVREQQIDRPLVLRAGFEGLCAPVGNKDRKASLLKYCLAQLCDGRLIIDHQDGRGCGWGCTVLLP